MITETATIVAPHQPRVLVVDDDQPIVDSVHDRLDAIGHTSHGVNTLDDARVALTQGGWSYCIIDLNLPVKFGRPASLYCGLTLLSLLRDEHPDLPVIVMTAFGHDSSDLAAEVISAGNPIDFVRKPFPEPGSQGHTLEQAARKAAHLSASHHTKPIVPVPTAFTGGVLALYPDRATLCGVWITGQSGGTYMRCILDVLAAQDAQGRPVRLTGPQLQDQLKPLEITTDAISGAIRDLRARITEVLQTEAHLVAGEEDVIQTGKRGQPGYRLAPTLTIERYDQPWQPHPVTAPAPLPTVRLTSSQPDNDSLSPELAAILTYLRTHGQATVSDLCRAHKLTERTTSRRLAQLRDLGMAHFVGTSRRGHWEAMG